MKVGSSDARPNSVMIAVSKNKRIRCDFLDPLPSRCSDRDVFERRLQRENKISSFEMPASKRVPLCAAIPPCLFVISCERYLYDVTYHVTVAGGAVPTGEEPERRPCPSADKTLIDRTRRLAPAEHENRDSADKGGLHLTRTR